MIFIKLNDFFIAKRTLLKGLVLVCGVSLAALLTPNVVFASVSSMISGALASIILDIGKGFLGAGFWMVQEAVGYTTAVITNDNVQSAWSQVRALSLSIFGITILVIAFMNIMKIQIQTWGVNRMIPKMILASFFIIFSKFLCISLINFSHAIVGSLQSNGGSSLSLNGLQGIQDKINSISDISFGMAWFVLLICIICFFVFIFLAVALLFRAVFLAFMIIVAPLAFALTILPWTEKYFQEWLKNFIKWVFFFPICMLILWVGMQMWGGSHAVVPDNPKATQTIVNIGGTSNPSSGFLGDFSAMLIVLVTIPLSVYLPLKMLGAAGQTIQNRMSGKKGIPFAPVDMKSIRDRAADRSSRIDKNKKARLGSALSAVGRNRAINKLGMIGGKDGNMNALGRAVMGRDKSWTSEKGARLGGATQLQRLQDRHGVTDNDIFNAATGGWASITDKKKRRKLKRFASKQNANRDAVFLQHFKNRGDAGQDHFNQLVNYGKSQRTMSGRYSTQSAFEKTGSQMGKEKSISTIKAAMKETEE